MKRPQFRRRCLKCVHQSSQLFHQLVDIGGISGGISGFRKLYKIIRQFRECLLIGQLCDTYMEACKSLSADRPV